MATAVPAKTGTDYLKKVSGKVSDGGEITVSEAEAASAQVEHWLQSRGVQYAPALEIPMILIDEKKSRLNQARREPIVPESVDRFAAAMKAGAPFPPIVCFINGGKLVIIDGNNRQAGAKKAGKDSIWGIVVSEETPSEVIQLLTVEANAHHGVTPELSWRLQQAFHLESIGWEVESAARAAGLTVQQFTIARRVQDAERRAKAMKIAGFAELPTYAKQALAPVKDDAVFYQAAKTAISTGMTIEEIRDMLRGLKGKQSEGARIEHIGMIAKERGVQAATQKAASKALNRVSSPKQALVTSLGKFFNIDEAALARSVSTLHDWNLIQARLKQGEEKLLALQIAMEQIKAHLESEE